MNVKQAYQDLLGRHGRQGWWPLLTRAGQDGFDKDGYHPGTYDVIATEQHRFEVYTGAILTQNTTWENAQKALQALQQHHLLNPSSLQSAEDDRIASLIEPAGYYNQKTTYLQAIADAFNNETTPTRHDLLTVTGVGDETADTILCYAHSEPRIIADEYTRRWLDNHGVKRTDYDDIQAYIDQRFPRNTEQRQELHALIVTDQKA